MLIFVRNQNKVIHSLLNCNNQVKLCKYSTQVKDVEKRRVEIMARGLPKAKPIPGVKNIILIASGKGGVGKSTTAANIATAFKITNPENNIGLLDADVFGPSIPLMMNLHEAPFLNKENLMEPLTNYGVKCMSMGFLIGKDSPLIWRGLMVMQALEKLMRQVHWGDIDYLIIDTPPGTGDTHLSLVQNLPIAGVVLVTTPQTAAIQVTKRGAIMFQKLNVPIIGVVENMSSIKCSACSSDIKLFGEGTVDFANEFNLSLLAQIPLKHDISEGSDRGTPIVVSQPDSPESNLYKQLVKLILDYFKK